MAKLYPPNIKGVIPAFYGTTLVVPFSMNKAVSEKEISGFEVKIKTISGEVKMTLATESMDDVDMIESKVVFTLPEDNDFKVGQFYKIQLAYIGKPIKIPGYYSTVGIAKYTVQPQVYIEGLEGNTSNTHIYNYVGVYSQAKGDASEKLYSSRFIVWDENHNVYKDTGEIIHNTTKDVNTFEATEFFPMLEELEEEKIFSIQFSITTVNLLQMKTPVYRIKQRRSINPEQKVYIKAEPDFVNGCINLSLKGNGQKTLSGNFIITRANSESNFLDWEKLFDFQINASINPERWYAKDFSAKQGVYYKYGIQQYNDNGVYAEKTTTDLVFSDFEDSFIYDGEKLLNIRYNPKVSSFKIDLQEQKQETIGSQFPYIFRNGHVNYKEFAVSGLISYLSDVDHLFLDEDKLTVDVSTTDLISTNIATERDFKLEVLKWLTNGKPKLFKSPGEGNYIVNFMNVSLSPIDSTGRMLHNFNSTAYEIMEYNGENLRTNNLIGTMAVPTPIRTAITITLSELDNDDADEEGFIPLVSTGLKSISFSDLDPGTLVKIDNEIFVIGSTGSLYFDGGEEFEMKKVSIKAPEGTQLNGSFTYSYSQYTNGYFDLITELHTEEVPLLQFFGNFYNNETLVNKKGILYQSKNIYDFLQDARTSITKMYMIRLQRRDHEELFIKPEAFEDFKSKIYTEGLQNDQIFAEVDFDTTLFYRDRDYQTLFDKSEVTPNKFFIIRLGYPAEALKMDHFMYEGYYRDAMDSELCPYIDYAFDGLSMRYFELNEGLYLAKVDDVDINIAERSTFEVPLPEQVSSLEIGPGVTAELSFAKMTQGYSIEITNPKLRQLKEEYLTLLEHALVLDADYKYYLSMDATSFYLEYKNNSGNNGGKIESSEALRVAYYKYLQELSKQLIEYKEQHLIV